MKEILLIAPLAGYKYRPDKLDHFFLEYLVKNSKYKIHLSEADDNNISKILVDFCIYNLLHINLLSKTYRILCFDKLGEVSILKDWVPKLFL